MPVRLNCWGAFATAATMAVCPNSWAHKPSPSPSRASIELQAERDHKALADRDGELSKEHHQWMSEHRKTAPPKDSLHARLERKHLAKLRGQARTEAEHSRLMTAHAKVLAAAEQLPTGLDAGQAAKLAADHKRMKADHEHMYLELLQMRAQHDTMLRTHQKPAVTP